MIKKIVLTVAIWGVFGLWSFYWIKIYISDIYFKRSQIYLTAEYVDKAQEYSDKAIKFNPFEPNYYRGRAKALTVSLVDGKDVGSVKNRILEDLEKAEELNPKNLVTLRNSVPIYYFLAIEDISLTSGIPNLDPMYLPVTKEFFKALKETHSHDVGVVTLLAKYEKKLGLDSQYLESRKIIERLRPELLDWHESFR
ncbi:MAG: hypothetical protein ABIA11_00390 [Patescibacteria group bacterium]